MGNLEDKIGEVLEKEVTEMINDIFVANVSNPLMLRDEICYLVYHLMLENTEFLNELVNSGDYIVTKDRIVKSILSKSDIPDEDTESGEVIQTFECPSCGATLEIYN